MTDQKETFLEEEYSEKIIQIKRVSKKTAGGNRFSFSVLVVVGNQKGKVGVGLGKAPDVPRAIRKASNYAKKHLVQVPMKNGTIPHEIFVKHGAAKVFLKPARFGTGLVAGGPVRAVLEASGIKNIVSKILGTSNRASNVYATFEAIKRLKPLEVEKQKEEKEEKASKIRKTKSSKEKKGESKTEKVKKKKEK